MDWSLTLDHPPADLRVVYDVGNEWGMSMDGRVLLTVATDGALTLEQTAQGFAQAWDGRLADGVFDALLAALREAGFPAAPPLGALPPGEDLRQLSVASGGQQAAVTLAWHGPQGAWKKVFELLDAVVAQAGQGKIRTFRDARPGLVASTTRR